MYVCVYVLGGIRGQSPLSNKHPPLGCPGGPKFFPGVTPPPPGTRKRLGALEKYSEASEQRRTILTPTPTHRGGPLDKFHSHPSTTHISNQWGGVTPGKNFGPPGQPRGGCLLESGDWPRNPPNTYTHTYTHTHTHTYTHTLGGDPWPNFHREPGTPNSPVIAIIERMGRSQSLLALFSVSRHEERMWFELSKHDFFVIVFAIVAFIVVWSCCLYSFCLLIKLIYSLKMTFDILSCCCGFV